MPTDGRPGVARVRDSARREWAVEPRRDARGRIVVFRPAHGDLEPFRASADGHPADTHLPIAAEEWELLARAAAPGADGAAADPALAAEAFRLVDRLVREAQRRQLMGAADDEEGP